MITTGLIGNPFTGLQPKWSSPQVDVSGPAPQDHLVVASATDQLESNRMAQDKLLAAWARGGTPAADKATAVLPSTVLVEVPMNGFKMVVPVATEKVGHWQPFSEQVHGRTLPNRNQAGADCYGVTFQVPLSNPLSCTLQVSIASGTPDPSQIIKSIVISHIRAAQERGVKDLPTHYTSAEQSIRVGDPLGELKLTPGHQPVPVGNKLRDPETSPQPQVHEGVTKHSDKDIEVRLGSGKTLHTTQERLQGARQLAAKITYEVQAGGRQVRASAAHIEKAAMRLAAFSLADQQALEKDGYKILLVDRKNLGWPKDLLGLTKYPAKTITIPTEDIDNTQGSDTLLHELAHAISDTRREDGNTRSILGIGFGERITETINQDKGLADDYAAYLKLCGLKQASDWQNPPNTDKVWSYYALHSPSDYFAEGVSFYKQGGASRALLESKDNKHFQRIKGMFPEG